MIIKHDDRSFSTHFTTKFVAAVENRYTMRLLFLMFVTAVFVLPGGGGGTPHMKGVGMLVGNFELYP